MPIRRSAPGSTSSELSSTGINSGSGGGSDNPRRAAAPAARSRALTKPLIGAINGVAITGGFELALNCDFLIASELAKFGDTHTRVGVMPGWGLTVLLPQAIGVRRAREMSFTGNFMSADEALERGLVNHVVPHPELIPFTRSIAADIVNNEFEAVRQIRQTYAVIAHDDDGWETEARDSRAWRRSMSSPETIAARRAAIQRARPNAVIGRSDTAERSDPQMSAPRARRSALIASAMSRARISAPVSLRWNPSSARTSLPMSSRGSMTYSAQSTRTTREPASRCR